MIMHKMLVFTSISANAFTLPATRTASLHIHDSNTCSQHQLGRSNSIDIGIPFVPKSTRKVGTSLYATNTNTPTPPLPDTSDPYLILNLSPTSNKQDIKKAYKRMALKYHPDVRTNSKSSEEERKKSNDDFARINAAYAFLSGKSADRPSSTESEKQKGKSGSGSGSGASSGYGYTPPHRRTGAERSRSSSGRAYSTDWQDYMPKYDEEEYDTNGDSFGSIFSDLFSSAASSAASSSSSGAGIMNDFISFLEGNFASPGTAQEKEEDVILNSLLRDGSMEEIKEELDDAKLLVKQLEQKETDLDSDLVTVNQEKEDLGRKAGGGTYMEDMRLEERKRELEARKEVVGDYLDRARMRQLKLRKRYEELRREGGSRRSSRGSRTSSSSGAYDRGSGTATGTGTGTGAGRSSTSTSGNYSSPSPSSADDAKEKNSDDDDSWKRESFGSSRRRRGSGRSRTSSSRASSRNTSSQQEQQDTKQSTSTYDDASTSRTGSSRSYASASSSSSASSSASPNRPPTGDTGSSYDQSSQANIPPHRRLTSGSSGRYKRNEEDKRRLREIKVDEEIEKMKKELGL